MPDRHDHATYYRASSTPAQHPRLTGNGDYAVCIVGAGFAGLGAAASLYERGQKDIVVLEAGPVGHGASGRNGGFVFGGFSLGEQALHAAGANARMLYGHTKEAMALIRRRIDRYGIDCDVRDEGVILANWFRDERILDHRQRFLLDHMDVHWQRLSRADMAGRLATDRYSGGLVERDAFHFHPLKYADGLARRLAAGGVAIHEHSAVTKLAHTGAVWRVQTQEGAITARDVVMCCGGYLNRRLHPRLRSAFLPIATYVMATEPLGKRLGTAIRTGAAVYDTRFAFDYYRALPDTRLLWGGRISALRRTPAQVARLLQRDMLRVYPQLADVKVEHAWSGLAQDAAGRTAAGWRMVRDGLRRAWRGADHVGRRNAGGGPVRRPRSARPLPPLGPAVGGREGRIGGRATADWYHGARDRLRR